MNMGRAVVLHATMRPAIQIWAHMTLEPERLLLQRVLIIRVFFNRKRGNGVRELCMQNPVCLGICLSAIGVDYFCSARVGPRLSFIPHSRHDTRYS